MRMKPPMGIAQKRTASTECECRRSRRNRRVDLPGRQQNKE